MARPSLFAGVAEVSTTGDDLSLRLGQRGWTVLIPLLLLVWFGAADAESVGRIAFFDLTTVYRQTGLMAQARQEWQSRLEERTKAMEAIARELEELNVQFRLQGATLSPEERKAEEEAIERKFEELTRDKARYQNELLQADQLIHARLEELISGAIAEVAKEQGYAAILERKQAGLYYLDKALDVSGAIVQRIKEKEAEEKMRGNLLHGAPPGSIPASTGDSAAPHPRPE